MNRSYHFLKYQQREELTIVRFSAAHVRGNERLYRLAEQTMFREPFRREGVEDRGSQIAAKSRCHRRGKALFPVIEN